MSDFQFPYVDALYREESIPKLAGNPFVEALPALQEEGLLATRLSYLPDFDSAERHLPGPERIQRLDALQDVMFALPRVVDLAQSMLKMIRTGYSGRKPFTKEDNARLRAFYELQQTGNFHSVRQTTLAPQHSMSLIGASGSGKSFSLRHIAGMLPPAIYHERLGIWQLPLLFAEMSYDGESVHSLASAIAQDLDRHLPDGDYIAKCEVGNAERRLARAFQYAHAHGVGMIVVDESQNQRSIGNEPETSGRKKSARVALKNETPLMKLLISASNIAKIPLLFAGTLEMQDLVAFRFSKARRNSGRGSAVWGPLTRSRQLDKPGEFEMLLLCLWRYQWIRKPVELNSFWADTFFHYTQGVPDIMVKLFESVQEWAIADGTETLTPELFAKVFDREFAAASFGITALREQDPNLLEAVTDLHHPSVQKKYHDAATQLPPPRQKYITPRAPAPAFEPKPPRPERLTHTPAKLQPVQLDLPPGTDMRTLLKGNAPSSGPAART